MRGSRPLPDRHATTIGFGSVTDSGHLDAGKHVRVVRLAGASPGHDALPVVRDRRLIEDQAAGP